MINLKYNHRNNQVFLSKYIELFLISKIIPEIISEIVYKTWLHACFHVMLERLVKLNPVNW